MKSDTEDHIACDSQSMKCAEWIDSQRQEIHGYQGLGSENRGMRVTVKGYIVSFPEHENVLTWPVLLASQLCTAHTQKNH